MSASSHPSNPSASSTTVGDTTRPASSSGHRAFPQVDSLDEALLALQDAQLARVRYVDQKSAAPDSDATAAAYREYANAVGVARIRVDEHIEHERVAA